MREALLPKRLVAVKVISPVPKISGGITMVSMALMMLSVVTLAPDFSTARKNESIAL
jgi:hypothetical protein